MLVQTRRRHHLHVAVSGLDAVWRAEQLHRAELGIVHSDKDFAGPHVAVATEVLERVQRRDRESALLAFGEQLVHRAFADQVGAEELERIRVLGPESAVAPYARDELLRGAEHVYEGLPLLRRAGKDADVAVLRGVEREAVGA